MHKWLLFAIYCIVWTFVSDWDFWYLESSFLCQSFHFWVNLSCMHSDERSSSIKCDLQTFKCSNDSYNDQKLKFTKEEYMRYFGLPQCASYSPVCACRPSGLHRVTRHVRFFLTLVQGGNWVQRSVSGIQVLTTFIGNVSGVMRT